MSGHPHAELMAKAAETAKTDKEWWKHFQYKSGEGVWVDLSNNTGSYTGIEYRLKPRYIDINGHQVPEPVREPLKIGQTYLVVDIQNGADGWTWNDDEADNRWLSCGLIHLTKEAAEAHIAALLSFTQK